MSSFKRTAKIKILNEVHAAIIGLHPTHIEWFYENYGIFAPNYYFNPKYKLGVWDGKIRYFYRTGKTYVYLLESILPKLQSLGYQFELIDQRVDNLVEVDLIDKTFFSHISDPDTDQPLELRYYQVELVNALLQHGHGVAIAGTGSGKTLAGAALVETYAKQGLRSITIVPSDDLISQTRNEFKYWELDVGEYSGSRKDINHTHVVSTWQALQNNPAILNNFRVVVVDECLDGNTLITMSDMTLKKLKDVQPGDKILSYNDKTNFFENDVVVECHKNLMVSSNEEMYCLEFDDGTMLEATGNHKILTTTGYKRVDELTSNDEIVNIVNRET